MIILTVYLSLMELIPLQITGASKAWDNPPFAIFMLCVIIAIFIAGVIAWRKEKKLKEKH